MYPTFHFFQQDVASYDMDDDDENDGVVPQRRSQVSQEHEDLVVKGEAYRGLSDFFTGRDCYDFERHVVDK